MEEKKKKTSQIFKKKDAWISGLIGMLLGAILLYVLQIVGVPGLGNSIIATTKSGKVTDRSLYKEIRKYYPINYMLEIVDKQILDKKYNLTEEQEKEINEQVDLILLQYENYGYTEEQFLQEYGFKNKEDFIDNMKFNYKTNLCCIDYFKTIIPEEDIQSYYNDNDIYGKISTKHILVRTSDSVTDEQALATANEIIEKLNNGTSFDEVVTEYGDKILSENVDFDSFNSSTLEESYVEASKALEKDKYTTQAVKTEYGYHVIYCINKEEKPSFEQAKDDIVEKLGTDLESEDKNIRYKALIKLREDNKLKIRDSKFKEEYKEFCDEVNSGI